MAWQTEEFIGPTITVMRINCLFEEKHGVGWDGLTVEQKQHSLITQDIKH